MKRENVLFVSLQIYVGVTDHLWGKHCKREFKDSRLLEYESWKEMYIRLSEEREMKLQRLTKSIVSAHSNKPKGTVFFLFELWFKKQNTDLKSLNDFLICCDTFRPAGEDGIYSHCCQATERCANSAGNSWDCCSAASTGSMQVGFM